MAARPVHIDIAQWVRRVFQSGFQLDRECLAQMQDCFGLSDPARLCADDPCSEAASFLELLFFPDRDIRQAFEARWGDQTFTQDAVDALLEELRSPPIIAVLAMDEQRPPLQLKVPDDALAAFVQRLNITWHPPDALRRVVQTRLAPPQHAMVGVWLRQARVPWHSNQLAMIDLFLDKFAVSCEDFEPCLTFLLAIIDTLEPEAQLFDFLTAKKYFYFQSLCKAESFENRRQKTNMETLILAGERAAHGSIAQWRELMRRVDRICTVLFGQTRFYRQPHL